MANTAQIALRSLGHKFPNSGGLLKALLPVIQNSPGVKHQVSTTLKGFQYSLDLRDYIQQQIFYFGCYDARGVKLVVDICRKINCRNALDIGANVGNHAIHLSEVCQNIYAFEPNCTPFNIFAKALSTKESQIYLNRFGLADKDGDYEFFLVDLNRMQFKPLSFEERIQNFARLTTHQSMVEVMSDEYAKLMNEDYNKTFSLMWKLTQEFQEKFHRKRRLKKKLKFWKK